MARIPPDHELNPDLKVLTIRASQRMVDAAASRAVAEGVDRSVIIRRWLRVGAAADGLSVSARPPLPVVLSEA